MKKLYSHIIIESVIRGNMISFLEPLTEEIATTNVQIYTFPSFLYS